jgi:hypothetical protein
MNNAAPTCLEVARFRLLPGVAEQDFLAANAATAGFLRGQAGFRRRVLSRGSDGAWTDHVEWESLTHAQEAMQRAMSEPALAPFMKAVDPGSMMCEHLEIAQHIA